MLKYACQRTSRVIVRRGVIFISLWDELRSFGRWEPQFWGPFMIYKVTIKGLTATDPTVAK